MGPSTHRTRIKRIPHGKRWALARVITALCFTLGAPAVIAFFLIGEHQLAYASLAVTLGTLGIIATGYTAGESYKPHDYGYANDNTVIIQQGTNNQSNYIEEEDFYIPPNPYKESR